MFFSKVVLFAISLGAISALATPHSPHHHALHRRAFAARVASTSSDSSDVAVKRQDDSDSDCDETSSAPSSTDPTDGIDQNPPNATSTLTHTSLSQPPPTTSCTDTADGTDQNPPDATPTVTPTFPPQQQPPTTPDCTDPTDSTVYGAPHTTHTRSPSSPPQQQPATTTSSTSPPQPSQSTNSSTNSSIIIPYASNPAYGPATYFDVGVGACGKTSINTDYMAALSYKFFDNFPGYNYDGGQGNPNTNPVCGRTATVVYMGKSVTVEILDRCAGCENSSAIDLSPAAFSQIADMNLGRIPAMIFFH